jgi:UDP-N-acetyl-D-glucosamine dehydrogenase
VDYHDPFVPQLPAGVGGANGATRSAPLTAARVKGYDCVIIVTDHSTVDYPMVVKNARCVVDTRNATRGLSNGRRNVKKL